MSQLFGLQHRGDGEIDTFFQFPFVEWEKRIRFAKKYVYCPLSVDTKIFF